MDIGLQMTGSPRGCRMRSDCSFILAHPSLNIAFRLKQLAHFVAMLMEVKVSSRREVLFRIDLGEGYYVTAIC